MANTTNVDNDDSTEEFTIKRGRLDDSGIDHKLVLLDFTRHTPAFTYAFTCVAGLKYRHKENDQVLLCRFLRM